MGSCKKCGVCCKWIYVTYPWGITLRELDLLRGMEQVDKNTVRAPVFCKNLDPETNLCKAHETKPLECRIFPSANQYIPKECKYNEEEPNAD
jgi:Fe-S-cluster containining protein